MVLVAPALFVGALVAAGFATWSAYWHSSTNELQPEVQFRNPFGFWSVVALAPKINNIF
jgi:hypothetical protein